MLYFTVKMNETVGRLHLAWVNDCFSKYQWPCDGCSRSHPPSWWEDVDCALLSSALGERRKLLISASNLRSWAWNGWGQTQALIAANYTNVLTAAGLASTHPKPWQKNWVTLQVWLRLLIVFFPGQWVITVFGESSFQHSIPRGLKKTCTDLHLNLIIFVC